MVITEHQKNIFSRREVSKSINLYLSKVLLVVNLTMQQKMMGTTTLIYIHIYIYIYIYVYYSLREVWIPV
jgi:hypothetical protein